MSFSMRLAQLSPPATFDHFSCRPNEKTTSELFSELDEIHLEGLLEFYKEDFDIHGYDPYKYSLP